MTHYILLVLFIKKSYYLEFLNNHFSFEQYTHHVKFLDTTSGTTIVDINKHTIPDVTINFKPFSDIIACKWKMDLIVGNINNQLHYLLFEVESDKIHELICFFDVFFSNVIGVINDIGYTQMSYGAKKQHVNFRIKALGYLFFLFM